MNDMEKLKYMCHDFSFRKYDETDRKSPWIITNMVEKQMTTIPEDVFTPDILHALNDMFEAGVKKGREDVQRELRKLMGM